MLKSSTCSLRLYMSCYSFIFLFQRYLALLFQMTTFQCFNAIYVNSFKSFFFNWVKVHSIHFCAAPSSGRLERASFACFLQCFSTRKRCPMGWRRLCFERTFLSELWSLINDLCPNFDYMYLRIKCIQLHKMYYKYF